MFNSNFANNNFNNLKSTSEFLNKQEKDPSAVTSNHLYKFNSQVLHQNELGRAKPQQIHLPVENVQEIYIEGNIIRNFFLLII